MSLRAKIVALVLGLTAAILAGLWLGLSGSWAAWSVEAVDRELAARAGAVAREVEVEHGELELEHDGEADVLRDPAHPFRIVAADGATLGGGAPIDWPGARPADGGPRFANTTDRSGRSWRVVTHTFDVEGGRVAVQVAGEAAPFGALEERFRRGLLLALGGALLVGGVGAAVLAHLSLAPMRRLANEVDAIGATSLERRVAAERLDPELRRVATAFNALLGRLEDAMLRQRQLVSRASHALRTPVATILTRAEVALRRDRDPAAYREALEDVANAARESAALVAHLLTLSRLDEQRGAVSREDVPVRRVAGDVARLLSPRAEEAGVSLEADVADGVTVRADPAALRELLEALVDNAIHYTPRGGRAGLRAEHVASGTVLTVWDTGPGIAPEERGKVFERFYRGAASEAGRPGSGLGLAIVKAIADAHGAPVELGERAGGGLEVTIRFPAT